MSTIASITANPRAYRGRADNNGEVAYYLVEYSRTAFNGFTLWEARNAAGIPVDGDPLSAGSNLVVTNKVATRHPESPYVAVVEVTWSVPTTYFTIFPPEEGETLWSISVESEGVSYVEPVEVDRDGNAIRNSALDVFDPGLVKEHFDEQITVSFTTNAANLTTLWDNDIAEARGKVNSDTVSLTVVGVTRSFPPETLKLGNARYGITYGQNSSGEFEQQFRVQLPLLYRFDTWKRKIVDQGFSEINASLEWVPILDAYGQPIQRPALLDGNGAALVANGTPVILEFDIEDSYPFNSFLNDIG